MGNLQYLSVFILVAIFTCECKKHVSVSETLSYKYVSHKWMKKIEDDKLLSAISIPGTHQSNRYLKTSEPMFQAWGLHNQLDAGVRFFDLHVSSDSIKYVKTGSVQESETLSYFLKTMLTFLVKQKKETLLLRVTPDEGAVARVTKLLSRDDWPVWRDKEIPTLGQVRGKIVLIQSSTLELGLSVHTTELNTDMDTKETQMKENIKKASQKCEQEMMLTYTVANGESEPLKTAKTLNKQVDNYLLNLKGDENRPHCVGIIAMDFPGPKVIQTIINFNGKLGEGTQIVVDSGSNEDVALPDSDISENEEEDIGGESSAQEEESHAADEEHHAEGGETSAAEESHAADEEHHAEGGETSAAEESHAADEEHHAEGGETSAEEGSHAADEEHHAEGGESSAAEESHAADEEHHAEGGETSAAEESHAADEEHHEEGGETSAAEESHAADEEHHEEGGETSAAEESHAADEEHHEEGGETSAQEQSHAADEEHHAQSDQHPRKKIIKKVNCHKVHRRPQPSPLL
uniref:Phosphatidylinositol-specific phospholipase C X domain-containing protein n=1 Tax=Cyprinus carpio carpio TaxID=630221 RepID=A0A9J8BBZ1_CYPCA